MTGNSSKPSISSHPAFRWAVGLWFAALLGAGLFVMPDGVHANIRQALGLGGIIPAGLIGKAALAGSAALFGLLLGMVLAGRVAALNSASEYVEEEDDYAEADLQEEEDHVVEVADDGPRRPFNPREFFGEEEMERALEADDEELEQIYRRTDEIEEIPAQDADFEPVVEEPVATGEIMPVTQASPVIEAAVEETETRVSEAFGDLPLSALTQRLQRALEASRAASEAPPAADEGELDPVIAFLRREADRTNPAAADDGGEDAQAALRSALDRLSQVSNPR